MRIIPVITATVYLSFCGGISAQEIERGDQAEIAQVLGEQHAALLDLCDSLYGKDIRLVNGRLYLPPYILGDGHPFLRDPEGMYGSVTVYGATFSGVRLNYDVFRDHLLYIDESAGGLMILLDKNNTGAFTLEGRRFVLLDPASGINIPGKQYFEVLYSGKVSLVQRHKRKINATISNEYPNGRYTEVIRTRYILKDGELHRFTNRYMLYKILADRKTEVKKYRRENRISSIRKAPDREIASLVEYYDSLIP
jgi:hypothetical protein